MSNFAIESRKQQLSNINKMKTRTLLAVLAVMTACSCSEKKEAQTVAPVSVKTMTVGATSADGGQSYPGTIEEEDGSALSFAGVGTVKSVNVDEGQFVSRGQLIGVIDATSARNAYDAAVAAKEQAVDAQRRMKMLHDNGSLPEIKWVEVQTQVRQAQASEQIAKKGLTDTRLYAPYSGYIVKKCVEAGANVGPGVPVVNLVKIDRVKVKISVPEEEISSIKAGMELRVSVSALKGRTYIGKVTEKNVSADALSRSYDVKASISNPRHELLPGMIADVTVDGGQRVTQSATATSSVPIALPASVIQIDSDNHTFVWTVVDGKARKTFVTTGANIGDKVAVTSGLLLGERVIVEGQQKVSGGMAVKES